MLELSESRHGGRRFILGYAVTSASVIPVVPIIIDRLSIETPNLNLPATCTLPTLETD